MSGRVRAEREDQQHEHGARQVVARDEATRPQRAQCPGGERDAVGARGHGGAGDVLLGDLVALERRHDLAAGEDEHPVAEALELDDVRREDDGALPLLGRRAKQAIDLDARAGVDAAGGLVGKQHVGVGEQASARTEAFAGCRRRARRQASPAPACGRTRCSTCSATTAILPAAADDARARELGQGEQRDVLPDAERQEDALRVTVAGKMDDAGPHHAARVAERHALPLQDRVAGRRQQPGERPQELTLPIALDAGEADDLAGTDLEIDVVEARTGQAANAEHVPFVGRPVLLREELVDLAADDQPQHVLLRGALGGQRAAGLAVAEHGDPVGDAEDLGQAVRDVDDGGAGLGDRPDLLEETFGLAACQRLRRLVEDQNLRRRARAPSRSRAADGRRRRARRRVPPGRSGADRASFSPAQAVHAGPLAAVPAASRRRGSRRP